ncbi:MAG TPA: DUF222 domain-containing protein, partial [Jatrophihabitans sp.]
QILVRAAGHLGPKDLRNVRTRLLATIDPDGAQPSEEQQRARRSLSMRLGADGMLSGRFQLSAGQGAKVMAVLHGHAAPAPAEDGSPDPRSSPQRLADSLEDLCDLALRAGRITAAGPHVALNITMTAEQYNTYTTATGVPITSSATSAGAPSTDATTGAATTGAATTGVATASASAATSGTTPRGAATTSARSHGLAETSYGQLIPVGTALGLCREASLAFIVQDSHGAVLNYRRTRRLASPAQTRALYARDKHCTFPGCDTPPDWCQRHHVIPWWQGGQTDLNNLTLVCGHHHREFQAIGWQCEIRDGLPYWLPPPWIDPQQKPQHNRLDWKQLLGKPDG